MWLHISEQAAAFSPSRKRTWKFHVMNFTGKPSRVEKLSRSYHSDFRYCILCNYTLTLYHVAFENFPHEVNWVGAFWSELYRPLQKIEAIMGGGRIFDTGPFFVRLR